MTRPGRAAIPKRPPCVRPDESVVGIGYPMLAAAPSRPSALPDRLQYTFRPPGRDDSHMWPSLTPKIDRYRELERLLVDPDVVTHQAKYGPLAKEHASLAKQVKPYLEFEQVGESIRQA